MMAETLVARARAEAAKVNFIFKVKGMGFLFVWEKGKVGLREIKGKILETIDSF